MAILGLIAVTLLPIFFAALCLPPHFRFRNAWEWLAAATIVGLLALSTLGYGISYVCEKLTLASLYGALGFMFCLAFLNTAWHQDELKKLFAARFANAEDGSGKWFNSSTWILGFLAVLVVLCANQVLHIRDGRWFVGSRNNLGDLSFHFHIISSWVFGDNFPSASPFFSGIPLRYPYLADFYSALFWRATGRVEWAVELPGVLLGWSLVILLFTFARRLGLSRLASALVALVFFTADHTAVTIFIKESFFHGLQGFLNSFELMRHGGYKWPNIINALWLPQRGFQFGFPLFLFLLTQASAAAQEKNSKNFFLLAVIAAPLPFVHGHVLLALAVYALVLLVRYPSWPWTFLLLPLSVIWLPQVLYLAAVIGPKVEGGGHLISVHLGWMAHGWALFGFWLKNAGPLLPVVLAASLYHAFREPQKAHEVYWITLSAAFIFALANIFQFSFWDWDNTKILVFAFLGFLPCFSALIAALFMKKNILWKLLAAVLLFFQVSTGFLELGNIVSAHGEDHLMFQPQDLAIAGWIENNTPPDALFLMAPTYNQPLTIAGRKTFMAYEGHIWSHGLPLGARRKELNEMKKGTDLGAEYYKKYGITHVIYGEREQKEDFDLKYLESHFDKIYDDDFFKIFRLPSSSSGK